MLAVLWVLMLAICVMVAVVYRQVDRMYRGQEASTVGGPILGAVFPSVWIQDGSRETELSWSGSPGMALVSVLTSTCGGCEKLVEVFLEDPFPEVDKTFLVTEGPGPPNLRELRERWPAWTVTHAADLIDSLSISAVPLTIVLSSGTVAAVGTPTDRQGVLTLMDEATQLNQSGSQISEKAPLEE